MKLNPIERWYVKSPLRRAAQLLVMQWFRSTVALKTGKTILEVGCGHGVGVKADAESVICKRHEDACQVVLD